MGPYVEQLLRWLSTLNLREWAVLAVCVFGLGALCMRGFGSRTSY